MESAVLRRANSVRSGWSPRSNKGPAWRLPILLGIALPERDADGEDSNSERHSDPYQRAPAETGKRLP